MSSDEKALDVEAVEVDLWKEDGTGKEQVDGTPTTCDSSFNRGYDKGYCAGMRDGAPPIRMPRWDQDPVVLRFGFLGDRCGNCGEVNERLTAERDRARQELARKDQALDEIRAALRVYWAAPAANEIERTMAALDAQLNKEN